MVGNLGKYASYWKFALADSQLGKGTFSAAHMRALEGRTIELEALKRQSLVSEEAWLAGETPKKTRCPLMKFGGGPEVKTPPRFLGSEWWFTLSCTCCKPAISMATSETSLFLK